MKISKLFHWLYGLVMLLPIFAIGVTCGYAMFNKNAYQSYYGDNINEIQYKQLDSNSSFELDNQYKLHNEYLLQFNTIGRVNFDIEDVVNNTDSNDYTNAVRLSFYNNTYQGINHMYIVFYDSNNTQIMNYDLMTSLVNFDFKIINVHYVDVTDNFYSYLDNFFLIEYEKLSYVSEVFYYSVDRVTQSNMFSWAYDSFLVTPFAYIVNLFSMPVNSPVVMLLSYWLSISIIWLVFDLVMYVPLLVHRWLDKGAIE